MTEENMAFMLKIILQYLSIIAGIITIFLGYRVFVKSTTNSDEISAKQIIPPIIFALLGTLIILATILQDKFIVKSATPVTETTTVIEELSSKVDQLDQKLSNIEKELAKKPAPSQVIISQSTTQPKRVTEKRADLVAIDNNMREILGLNDTVKMPEGLVTNDTQIKGFLDSIETKERGETLPSPEGITE